MVYIILNGQQEQKTCIRYQLVSKRLSFIKAKCNSNNTVPSIGTIASSDQRERNIMTGLFGLG
jgi:hypothetical protein